MADQSARKVSLTVEHGVGARTAAARAVPAPRPAPDGFRHGGAVVGDDGELLGAVLPFLEEGLRAGDLVVLSGPADTLALLRAELGPHRDDVVEDLGLTLLGARAPDALSRARSYTTRAAGTSSGRLRVFSAVCPGDHPVSAREAQRFDSACNELLATAPLSVLCSYDRRQVPAPVVDSVPETHPFLVRETAWTPSRRYRDPLDYVPGLTRLRHPLEDRPPVLAVDEAPALAGLRHQLGAALAGCVDHREHFEDLHLAVSEVAANAFRHGRRPVSARLWCGDGDLVCAITDSGPGFDDPLAGFQPAHGDDLSRGGMGLWLARKLWDSVDLLPGPAGFTVRLSTRLR